MENLITILTTTFLKSAIVLLVALVAVLLMRRSSAAARHLVWAGAVAGVLALPVLSFLLPGWSAAPVASVVENTRMASPAYDEEVVFEAGTAEPGFEEPAAVPGPAVSETVARGNQGDRTLPVDAGIAERRDEALAVEAGASAGTSFSLSAVFRRWAPWIWLGGASFAFLPLVLGTSGLFRLKRTARRVKDPAWLSLLAELCSELKVGRKVCLLESPVCTMPMTWGALPGLPANIVVPEDALHEWTPDRRRAVLLHELAHVKRRDCLTQTLSQFACALYWLNPLVWVAAHRMLVERERACDDLALRNAMQPSEYAKHLLEIATGHTGSSLARHAAVAMARPSGLGNRLVAVLDQRRNRKSLSRLAAVAAIALLGAVVVPVAMLQAEEAVDRPNLSGLVTDESGQVLRDATVFINTAAPREGLGILCPSCYVDCTKSAKTDSEGRFTIESLDPELIFEVLVVAEGFRPKFVEDVDPFEEPLDVALEPVSPGDTPNHRVRGRVVDGEGKPLPGAVAWLYHVTQGERSWVGRYEGFDPVAVADENGEFVIHSREPFEEAGFKVEARGMAPRTFPQVPSGDTVHELPLTEGVSVTGRVMKDGNPLAGVEVGMTGADRGVFVFAGDHSVATDDDGYFLIVNLPPETEYYFYGSMESLEGDDIISSQRVQVGEDGTTVEMGEINVETGFLLEGRIRLADGEPAPEGTRFLLSRQRAWDSIQAEVDAAGRFRVDGVPSEPVKLSAGIDGYRPSLGNASLDGLNPTGLIGTVYSDKTDLVLELEPGERRGRIDDYFREMEHEPLRGVEPSDEADDIRVNGRVVDAETGDPLPSFAMTPGRESSRRTDEVEWFHKRRSNHTAGTFSLSFQETGQAPVVLIEAAGYFSNVSDPLNEPENDLIIEMEKGPSLSGVVLRPDGQPAAEANVYLADTRTRSTVTVWSGNRGVSVSNESTPGEHRAETDESGRFSFFSRMDPNFVVVLDDAGYAEVPVEGVVEGLEVRLQPWATVEGRLLIGADPAENERVRLTVNHIPLTYWGRLPPVSYSLSARTDSEGAFVFKKVPPLPVEIYHSPDLGDNPHGTIPRSQSKRFEALPGETHQLTLGGTGRPVVGRMVAAGNDADIDWTEAFGPSLVYSDPRPAELESEVPELISIRDEALRTAESAEEREAIEAEYIRQRDEVWERMDAAYNTESGREYFFSRRQYDLDISPDGRFRVEDVPGGEYVLSVAIMDEDAPREVGKEVATIVNYRETIEVPESPNGRSDEPYDLGVIETEAN